MTAWSRYVTGALLGGALVWAGLALAAPSSRPVGDISNWKHRPKHAFSDGEKHFRQVMTLLRQRHLNTKLDEGTLYKAAIQGMLQLSNPKESRWNKLLSPTELAEMQVSLHSRIAGIGIQMSFDAKTGISRVLGIIPNSPAQRSDLRKGDQILKVNGVFYRGKNIRDVVYAIRGKSGTKVTLTILRDAKIATKVVTRGKVKFRPLRYWSLPGGIGLIKIHLFAYATPKLMRAALLSFAKKKTKSLIVDLRHNSGGALKSALQSADLLLKKGQVIASLRGRDGKMKSFRATQSALGQRFGQRIHVLIDGRTSSGAELFAAALKAHRKARLIGMRSFGKWNVQKLATLANGYAIKYTIGQFFDPLGKQYHGKGLQPDISLPASSKLDQRRPIENIGERLTIDSQLRVAHAMLTALP